MSHSPITPRTVALTFFTLIAFASNSVLCRLALAPGLIGAGTFTGVRLLSGAVVLMLLVALRGRATAVQGGWGSAVALFAYAAPFSFAYLRIPAGVGALVLFGTVQATMIGSDLLKGKRLRSTELAGLVLAVAGLTVLTLPGVSAPDPAGVGLMIVAGVAWGIYSLRGRAAIDPLKSTATNFSRSLLFAIPLGIASLGYETSHCLAFPMRLPLEQWLQDLAMRSGIRLFADLQRHRRASFNCLSPRWQPSVESCCSVRVFQCACCSQVSRSWQEWLSLSESKLCMPVSFESALPFGQRVITFGGMRG